MTNIARPDRRTGYRRPDPPTDTGPSDPAPRSRGLEEATFMGFILYLSFTVSWFLHLPARLPFLGIIRFDLLLIVMITLTIIFSPGPDPGIQSPTQTDKRLRLLLLYVLFSLPFVEWPGTVLRQGIESLLKAIVFYYFTLFLVFSYQRLKTFVAVFLAVQTFRAIEPLYLHLTQGYWGSVASMDNWELLQRLSGAPSDVINPNGLAYVILTVFPFFYYLPFPPVLRVLSRGVLLPSLVYELALTGSRSGFLGLLAVSTCFFITSRRKLLLAALMLATAGILLPRLTPDQKDRILSVFDTSARNAGTAQARMHGVLDNLMVGLRRPILGHGLGTSAEANANFGTTDQISHNLYTEILEELGLVGLVIFAGFMQSVITNFSRALILLRNNDSDRSYLRPLVTAMRVWLVMNLLFSLASYGLSSYEWYLFGGLSVVVSRILTHQGTQSPSADTLPSPDPTPQEKASEAPERIRRKGGGDLIDPRS